MSAVLVSSRTLPMPTGPTKLDRLFTALKKLRHQHRKWKEPEDAKLVLNLHFSVTSFGPRSFHADATLEIPTDEGFVYASVAQGGCTEYSAMRAVIVDIETSNWFHHMKSKGVAFRITGDGACAEIEALYRGFL